MADVTVKIFEFLVVAVYASNIVVDRVPFFRRLAPFLYNPKRIVLIGDWNAILDLKIDRVGREARGLGKCENSLIDFMARHDVVDRFRLDHPGKEMWMWQGNSRVRSYLDRVLEELTLIFLLVSRSTM